MSGNFGVSDLPNGVRLRMTSPSDKAFEQTLHDANRHDLSLIDGSRDFVRSIYDLQMNARDAGYSNSFPNAMYYIIEKNGDKVGRLAIDAGPVELHIIDVAVLPNWHGQGIGKTVIQAMQKVAGGMNLPVTLAARHDNPVAMQLYQSLGFTYDPDDTNTYNARRRLRWLPKSEQMRKSFIMSTT